MSTFEISRRKVIRAGLGGSVALMAGVQQAHASWLSEILNRLEEGGRASTGGGSIARALSKGDAAAGVREALRVAASRTIQQVGRVDGYFLDQAIHIDLPDTLKSVQSIMNRMGMSDMLDDLELRLNRAAELAAPHAKSVFGDAIRTMTIDDAIEIVKGPDDSATRYFKKKMMKPLRRAYRPIIVDELDNAGAMRSFDKLAQRYSDIPFVGDLDDRAKDELVSHGLKQALRGLFHYLAREEAAIRNDPGKRTTEILKEVFG